MNNSSSMFTKNNRYGYHLNINHPEINKLFIRYKQWKQLPSHYPLSDEQRIEFEAYIMPKVMSKYNNYANIETR